MTRAFTLSVANVRQNPKNTRYPNIREVKSVQDLTECLKYDHLAGVTRNNERGNENFEKANCLIMDLDNDYTDNANEWREPEYISEKLHGVEFFTCYSRNHKRDKYDEKTRKLKHTARTRFHVYFPLARDITDTNEIRRYKEKLLSLIPEFDAGAKDAARLIYGVEHPQILHFDGDSDILAYLDSIPDTELNLFDAKNTDSHSQSVMPVDTHKTARIATESISKSGDYNYSGTIKYGERNNKLYHLGLQYIARFESVNEAFQHFLADSKRCESPLPDDELQTIWRSVLNSDARRLADLARRIGNKESFILEAKKINGNERLISMVAGAVFEAKKINQSTHDKIFKAAIYRLMYYKKLENARNRFLKDTSSYVDSIGLDYINEVWNEALNTECVRLAILARKYSGNKEIYEDEALKVSEDTKLISSVWDKEEAKSQKYSGGKHFNVDSGNYSDKKKLIPLNINAVDRALKDMGISIRLNKITQRVIVENLPHGNPYVLEDIHNLSGLEQKNVALNALPGILLPYLKDLNYSASLELIELFLNVIAQSRAFNPVEDMFKSKKWDGSDRLSQLYKIMGIESNDFYCTLTRKWLIQAVAMALNDDGKHSCEFVLTLQGAQGAGKTEFFRNIAMNSDWFKGATVIDLKVKDTYIEALTHWICELGEVDGTFKYEQSQLKGFITDNKSIYRLPYARTATERARRTVFGATVNPERFIKDTSGGTRRWATIRITKIDSAKMRELPFEWYQQLWAQSYAYFCKNEHEYRLTEAERALLENENQTASEFIRGEAELLENLDWDSPVADWTFKTATQFINEASLQHSLRPAEVGKALQKIMTYDKRIKSKRSSKGTLYLLPTTNYQSEINTRRELVDSLIERTELKHDDIDSLANQATVYTLDDNAIETAEATTEIQQFDAETLAAIQACNENYKHHAVNGAFVTDNVKALLLFKLTDYTTEDLMPKMSEYEALALENILNRIKGREQEAQIAQKIWVAKYNAREGTKGF